uniref:Uncharacterized protein n=1 Tax=Anguilla anguilla TaxID=7936 RepID=A0A0E9PKW7_ANGAN
MLCLLKFNFVYVFVCVFCWIHPVIRHSSDLQS